MYPWLSNWVIIVMQICKYYYHIIIIMIILLYYLYILSYRITQLWIQNSFVASPVACIMCFDMVLQMWCDWFTILIVATNLELRWIWISSGTHGRNMSILGDDRILAALVQKENLLIPIPKLVSWIIFPQVQASWLLAMLPWLDGRSLQWLAWCLALTMLLLGCTMGWFW